MKNQYIYILILLINLMLIGNDLFSQNIYNVFNNKVLEVKGAGYKEVYSKSVFFKDKIQINYFKIESKNSSTIEQINKKIHNICNDYLIKEVKSIELYNEFKDRLEVYNKVNYSKNNRYNGNACSLNMFQLENIRSSPISMIAGKVFIEVRFEFKRPNRGNYDSKIEIIHYYIANLKSGKIERWKNNFNTKEINFLRESLSRKLNATYSESDDSYKFSALELYEQTLQEEEYYEDYEEDFDEDSWKDHEELMDSIKKSKENEDICKRIDFSEANIYWLAWGMVVEFQDYSYSSQIYYGNHFRLLIPFEEAKRIFSSFSDFSFLNSLSMPTISIHNFNIHSFNKKSFRLQKAPTIIDALRINPVDKMPLSLSVETKNIAENVYISKGNKYEYKFHKNGRLLSKTTYQDTIFYESETYRYDNNEKLISINKVARNNKEYTATYVYDNNNNLIEYNNYGSKEFYFYNGDYIYSYRPSSREAQVINRMKYTKNKFDNNYSTFLLNNKGNIIAISPLRHLNHQAQYGRDSLGRITEAHTEGDRNNYYWEYDKLNRITNYKENGNKNSEVQFLYKGDSTLPYKRRWVTYSYRGDRIQEESYTWGF